MASGIVTVTVTVTAGGEAAVGGERFDLPKKFGLKDQEQ